MYIYIYTLSETNSSHLKIVFPKGKAGLPFLSIFRCEVIVFGSVFFYKLEIAQIEVWNKLIPFIENSGVTYGHLSSKAGLIFPNPFGYVTI